MPILITGGSGYIGSHLVRMLLNQGEQPIVLDRVIDVEHHRSEGSLAFCVDLCSSEAVPTVRKLLVEHGVTAVIHLAALKQVAESVEKPAKYYRENVGSLANLLLAIEGSPVNRFVFSSSAAVYGNPSRLPVREIDQTLPISPYGETKLVGEWLVRSAARALGIRSLSLRYFNVAGAGWPDLGDPESLNLLTIAMDAVESGRPPVIFGNDYATDDGSAVRDYVHVLDLARAHLAALEYLVKADQPVDVFNVGRGVGVSVSALLHELTRSSGVELEPVVGARRPGDAAEIVAEVSRIQTELSWRAKHSVADMVDSAWNARRSTHSNELAVG